MSDIKTGTVVRGLKNANLKPFSGEEVDGENRLVEASVNCIEGSDDIALIRFGMSDAMQRYGFKTAKAEKIIQKGGRIMTDPVRGNANHCLIVGLSLKDANNLFS